MAAGSLAVRVTPPAGFAPSALVRGWHCAATGASLRIDELPVDRTQVVSSWTAAALAAAGLQNATVQPAGRAVLLTADQPIQSVPVRKWVAAYATGGHTALVVATCPLASVAATGPLLRNAVLAAEASPVDRSLEPQLRQSLAAGLHLVTRTANQAFYTASGQLPPATPDEPGLCVTTLDVALSADCCRSLAQSRMRQFPTFAVGSLIHETSLEVKPIAGWESRARGWSRTTGNAAGAVAAVVASAGNSLVIEGVSSWEAAETLFAAARELACATELEAAGEARTSTTPHTPSAEQRHG